LCMGLSPVNTGETWRNKNIEESLRERGMGEECSCDCSV
jgi:hypothetical protein